MLRMTREAMAYADRIVRERGCAPLLRVRVIGGGCNGLRWVATLGDATSRPGDRRRRNGLVDVIVDGISAKLLEGAEVHVGSPGAAGLTPAGERPIGELDFLVTGFRSRHVCSCGESFTP